MLFWLLWTLLRLAPVIVDTISTYVIEYRDHGLIQAVLLNTVLTQAKLVITRIRTHVLASPAPVEEALAIRNSYKDSFNMIAVAVSHYLHHISGHSHNMASGLSLLSAQLHVTFLPNFNLLAPRLHLNVIS